MKWHFRIVNNKLLMNNSRHALIEENHPAVRRRSLTTLDSLLRNTRAESFLSYISEMKQHKKSLRESEEAIASHFRKISQIISNVDDHITKRLEHYESEIFSLVKAEIEEMRSETQKVVQTLNDLIIKKNNEDQLDYFKSETLKLFNQNKKMREEIAHQKILLKEADIEFKNNKCLMQVLKKKYMKQHLLKQKLVLMLKEKINAQSIHQITVQDIDSLLKMEKNRHRLSLKTQQFENKINHKAQVQEKIHFYLNKPFEDHVIQLAVNNKGKNSERLSCPSSLSQQYSNSEIESIQIITPHQKQQIAKRQEEIHSKKVNSYAQTEDCEVSTVIIKNHYPARHFSCTCYVQLANQSQKKQTGLVRNGFCMKNYNQKATIETNKNGSKFNENKRHMRYMSLAFNKNKVVRLGREIKGGHVGQFSIQ